MGLPKISIVTPSFNQSRFLDDTIHSVLDQNYSDLEYVIIDGGSTDGSADIIKKHEDRLHYWVSEKDKGHGNAINKGFSKTSGEIMGWINSDDKLTPWSLNVVAEIFNLFPEVEWIVGFNSWWNENGAMTNASRVPKNIYDFLLGKYGWIQQESVFWRRSLWEKSGGFINEDYKFMVDGELWTRFFLHSELHSVDCILSGYRYHSENRAKNYYDTCIDEMDNAINLMRTKCSPEIIHNYKKLKFVNRFIGNSFLHEYPVSKMISNYFIPKTFAAAAYKNIYYDNGRWNTRNLPFTL